MTCTKMEQYIPEDKRPKTDKVPKKELLLFGMSKLTAGAVYDPVTKV